MKQQENYFEKYIYFLFWNIYIDLIVSSLLLFYNKRGNDQSYESFLKEKLNPNEYKKLRTFTNKIELKKKKKKKSFICFITYN